MTSRLATIGVVLLLATGHVWLAWSASARFGPTGDENAHLTGGYSYWKFNDYRLHPENGNLAQRWVALPLLAQDLRFPWRDTAAWREGAYVPVGEQFLYELGNDLPRMLRAARFMNALLGGALVIVVFAWSRSLFGATGGLLSAVLAAFCPHLLAHAGLANSDITASLAFLVALLAWWRLLHRPSLGRVAVAGVSAGALALAKFSAVLFVPIAIALAALRLAHPAPLRLVGFSRRLNGFGAKAGALLSAQVAAGLFALAVIWAAYGFRFAATPDGTDPSGWDWARHTQARFGGVGQFVRAAHEHRWLPDGWNYGLGYVHRANQARPAFLAGYYSPVGWREFFPLAFLVKTTLGAQALLLLGLLLPWGAPRRRTPRWLYRLAPLLLFVGLYAAVAVSSRLNIGHRHILPLYPALYVLAGGVAAAWRARPRRWLAVVIASLLGWHVAAATLARPHYLAYFNESIGGSTRGYRYLVDSSLDWGQSLADLGPWLAEHAPTPERIYLSYFGNDRLTRHGIVATRLADAGFDAASDRPLPPRQLQPGWYCISATLLQQVYTPFSGPWTSDREQLYWALRREFAGDAPRVSTAECDERLRFFDQIRFARLCRFLRQREPEAAVGHSILIYRLDHAALTQALEIPWFESPAPNP